MKTITVKHEVSRVVKVANSAEIFGAKRCASTIRFVLKPTDARAPPEYRKPKCLLFDCWLEQPYKKCEACKKACMEAEYDNGTAAFHG